MQGRLLPLAEVRLLFPLQTGIWNFQTLLQRNQAATELTVKMAKMEKMDHRVSITEPLWHVADLYANTDTVKFACKNMYFPKLA